MLRASLTLNADCFVRLVVGATAISRGKYRG